MEDTTIEDVLKTVADLYNQKDYEKALKTLNANQKQMDAELWHYNVGSIYGKLENWPLARYHFLMAELKGFSAKEMITNLEIAETKLDVVRLEKPLSIPDYLVKYSLLMSEGILTTLCLVFILIGLVGFWRMKSAKALIGFVFLGLTCMGLQTWIRSWDKLIVVETQTIQEGPSAIFGSRDELPVGVMLVTKPQGDWLNIQYPSRFQGWIKNKGLKELK